jgi:hypothetical protein
VYLNIYINNNNKKNQELALERGNTRGKKHFRGRTGKTALLDSDHFSESTKDKEETRLLVGIYFSSNPHR